MEGTIMVTSQSKRALTGLTITQALLATGAAAALPAPAGAQETATNSKANAKYVARLSALNTTVTGRAATGMATFAITGDSLTIVVEASGLPKDIGHWQHLHGFTDARQASCPTLAADANGDGIVDLIETEPMAGTTMVPLNDDPVAMDIPHDTYPKASATGTLHYRKTVPLSALQVAFGKAFDGQKLDLDRRVVFVHGIPAAGKLQASVASLGPIPAQVTLPIACGRITRPT
jgi:hypothetical protein